MRAKWWAIATAATLVLLLASAVEAATVDVSAAVNLTATGNSSGDGYYERDPSLLQASDGTWYLVYSKSQTSFTHGGGVNPDNLKYDIYVRTSSNQGATWSGETKVLNAAAISGDSNFRNAAVVEADGKIWVIGANVKSLEGDIYANTRSGGTWSGQSMIFDGTNDTGAYHLDAVAEGNNIRLFYGIQNESKGIGFIKYHGDTDTWDSSVTLTGVAGQIPRVAKVGGTYHLVSTAWDNIRYTKTTTPDTVPWPASTAISAAPSGGYACDPSILNYANGGGTPDLIVLNSPSYSGDSQPVEYVYSTDNGATWSSSKSFTDARHGTQSSWDMMPRAYLKDAATMLVFVGMEQRGVARGQADIYMTAWPLNATVGNAHYTTIQDGIDNAAAGDTINVAAGTYREYVVLNKSVTVTGDRGDVNVAGPGPNAPILDGDLDNNGTPDKGDGFTIPKNTSLSGITVEGFIIRNFGNGGGENGVGVGVISWENTSSYVTIRDNRFVSLGYNGIYVGTDSDDMQSNWLVQRNQVVGAPYAAIELTDVTNSQVLDNEITAPATIFDDPGDAGVGIEIAARARNGAVTTSSILVKGNTISGAFAGGSRAGINLLARAYASGRTAVLSGITVEGNTISGSGTRGIYVVAESRSGGSSRIENLSVTGNTLAGNTAGIEVGGTFTAPKANGTYDVATITIHFSNIAGNTMGVDASTLSGVTVDATDNWWGDASGPYHATLNPAGLGNPVSNNVTFSPWTGMATGVVVEDPSLVPGETLDNAAAGVSVQNTGTGTTGVIIAEYTAPPAGTPSFGAGATYVDVQVDNPSGITALTITFEHVAAGTGVIYFYRTGTGWIACSNQTQVGTTITVTVTAATTPTLLELTGTVLAEGTAKGNVNGDSVIDVLDARLCLQIATGFLAGTPVQRAAADVDNDGDVDLADAEILAEYIIGIITELGPGAE